MLDLRFIREKPDLVREALSRRGDIGPLDQVLARDREWRVELARVEELRHRRNATSKDIGRMPPGPHREALIAEMRRLGEELAGHQAKLQEMEAQLNQLLLELPNLPHESVPLGRDETGNRVVRYWDGKREFPFQALPHWELGPSLGIIDFERGVKLSGSRFYVLRGAGARLQRTLIAWMLDLHVERHGYTEVYPPFVVREEILLGAGQLPKFRDNLYHDVEDDLWLVPTAEVPLTNLHRGEILAGDKLPLYYVAYTPCFRREKAAAGRDTRGIKRGHQFDKVELYKFVRPEKSFEELEKLVADAAEVLQLLELPYRVVELCSGDLGFTSAKSYDLEVWAPGCGEWLEVSSCSNCTDFQARRADIRFRRESDSRPEFVHTLNGSGLALPRTVIAILENYQEADGSIAIPEVLRPYMGGLEAIR